MIFGLFRDGLTGGQGAVKGWEGHVLGRWASDATNDPLPGGTMLKPSLTSPKR